MSVTTSTSIFSQAIDIMADEERVTVVTQVETWRGGTPLKWSQVAQNITAETALSVDDLAVLLNDFAAELLGGGRSPEDCWIQACRRNQFKGQRVAPPLPSVLGRAMPIESYASLISGSPDVLLTPDQCLDLLRRVAMAGPAASPRDARLLRRARLGRFVIWATFCAANSADSPFIHLPRTTDAIRTALGLGECPMGTTLVLVSYHTRGPHTTLSLYRPTIAEAESYHWYRPQENPAAAHGLTCPLSPNDDGLAPQPEVVHAETIGETLLFPLYIAV